MSTAVSATTAAALPLLFPFLVLLWVLSMVQIPMMVLLIHTPFVSLGVFDFFVVVVVVVDVRRSTLNLPFSLSSFSVLSFYHCFRYFP